MPISSTPSERNSRYRIIYGRRGIHDVKVDYNNSDPKRNDTDDDSDEDEPTYIKKYNKPLKNKQGSSQLFCKRNVILIIVVCALMIAIYPISKKENKDILDSALKNLRLSYPNENSILWQNVRKMAYSSQSAIHSLVLLYNNRQARAIAEHFARDLGTLLNNVHNLGKEVVAYTNSEGFDNNGELLEHYLNVVKANKLLIVPELHTITGDSAMIFHTLCDESMITSTSYFFIFTLHDKNVGSKSQNMMTRAASILRNSWHDLPGNELHSLISRVVRNVAEISITN